MWFDTVELFYLWVYKNHAQSISELKDEIICVISKIEFQSSQNVIESVELQEEAID